MAKTNPTRPEWIERVGVKGSSIENAVLIKKAGKQYIYISLCFTCKLESPAHHLQAAG